MDTDGVMSVLGLVAAAALFVWFSHIGKTKTDPERRRAAHERRLHGPRPAWQRIARWWFLFG